MSAKLLSRAFAVDLVHVRSPLEQAPREVHVSRLDHGGELKKEHCRGKLPGRRRELELEDTRREERQVEEGREGGEVVVAPFR